MADNKWDDDRIEQLLRDFPKIEDHRPKEEVHKRLKKDTAPPKRPMTWLPAAVAALAFLTLGVLLATYLTSGSMEESASMEVIEEEAAMDGEMPAEGAEPELGAEEEAVEEEGEAAATEEAETAAEAPVAETGDSRTAVYPSNLDGYRLLTLGLTSDGYVTPVSFLVDSSLIPEGADTAFLYNQFASEVDEEALGFDEYHPYPGEISSEGETIIHELPADHEFGLSSAATSVYLESLKMTFREADQIIVTDESGNPASFDPVGPVEPFEGGAMNAAYFIFNAAAGQSYLAPDYSRTFSSAAEAIAGLQSPPNDLLVSPIPSGVSYDVSEEGDRAVVTFNEPLDLTAFSEAEAIRFLESLALTASSFGKQVVLENVMQAEWNGFNLMEPLEVPVAPNKVLFTP